MKTLILIAAFLLLSSSELHSLSVADSKAICDTARSYNYVRETSTNSSPIIDAWCDNMRVPRKIYWCMVYVWTVYDKVFKAKGKRNPLKRTASCAQQLEYAASFGSVLKCIDSHNLGRMQLQAGDIFIMNANGHTDPELIGTWFNGHTGIILQDNGATDTTNEGNTNKAGSRNGDRVAQRERKESKYVAVLRA